MRALIVLVALASVALLSAPDAVDQSMGPAVVSPRVAGSSVDARTAAGPSVRPIYEFVAGGFDRPVDAASPPSDDRIFVVEKAGLVWIVESDGTVLDEPFLDLTSIVKHEGSEQGLVGLAFHPAFESNGRLYVFLTNLEDDVEILEFRTSRVSRNRAERLATRQVLLVPQPHQYHNGGTLRFGPDGYLYIGLGDGGGIGDQFENGQDFGTLPGSIIRIDVDAASPYAVPADNPFLNVGAPEIWVYGLRNPWRFFIDFETRTMVVGDVGQEGAEEIDILPLDTSGGANLGWSDVEGTECYNDPSCDPDAVHQPALTYPHGQGCAVIGGPIYRGNAIPGLRGWVVFADFCFGWVRALSLVDGEVIELLSKDAFDGINSLAVDYNNEILVLSTDGDVLRLIHG